MITQEIIRIYLQDKPEINRLIGKVEFPPEQIKIAMKLAISEYNETPPLIGMFFGDESDFPFPNLLLEGTVSKLLFGKSLEKFRNRLPYNSNAGSIDDEAMADPYSQLGAALSQSFMGKIRNIKIALNVKRGWGHAPSEYSSSYFSGKIFFK